MDSFLIFLQENRRLDDITVSTFRDEKIDCCAVNSMSDEQLMKYVPRFGDRIAVRQYCRREVAASEGISSTVSKATENLMAKLNERHACKRKHNDSRSQKLYRNLNAQKAERNYQMGLFEEVGDSFVQIKGKRGGGIRHLKALKTATMAELLKCGKQLFFPNGKNKLGDITEFEITMRDFTEEELDPLTTLGEQYETRKVKVLRLYLSCKRIDTTTTPRAEESLVELQSTSAMINFPSAENYSVTAENSSVTAENSSITAENSSVTAENSSVFVDLLSLPVDSVVLVEDDTFHTIQETSAISVDEEIQLGYAFMQEDVILDDTIPLDPFERAQTPPPPHITKMRLRRGHVFQDLNAAFKNGLVSVDDSLVEIEMVLPNGSTEKGEDSGGILRDALSEYWETFLMKCTTGNTLKVPMTRHDMKDEWECVAKVMVLGYNTVKYFPIMLAKPFLCYSLGLVIAEDDLFSAFLATIPPEEKQLAEQAVRDFSSVSGSEEWFEFLEAHDVKLLVTEKNARKTLLEVAHKEIVQNPAYIAEQWSHVLKRLRLPSGGLDELMTSLTPTARKVVAILQHESLSNREQQILDFLKRFIRNCSDVRLKKFLRFCTGADLLVASAIHVRFVEPNSAFTRSPQAHTCGCVLEVPNNYTSYPELAEEFGSVLDANIWVMDII
ncbi:uncharacterized protein LOC143521007 [Brachyhypopomus gauderio]|uniref:uncharacterized protein LOC143521007 n=1 Tax=Brachyhypopomus gauderio TaxID=698409 RepID=UPI0040418321